MHTVQNVAKMAPCSISALLGVWLLSPWQRTAIQIMCECVVFTYHANYAHTGTSQSGPSSCADYSWTHPTPHKPSAPETFTHLTGIAWHAPGASSNECTHTHTCPVNPVLESSDQHFFPETQLYRVNSHRARPRPRHKVIMHTYCRRNIKPMSRPHRCR